MRSYLSTACRVYYACRAPSAQHHALAAYCLAVTPDADAAWALYNDALAALGATMPPDFGAHMYW